MLLLLALGLLGRAEPVQAAPPTLEAYRQIVAEAYAAAQRSDRIGLDDRAEALLQITDVALPDGTLAPVDNTWLRAALAQEPPAFPEIVARLGAVLDALGQPRNAPPGDALQKLNQVYEAPPFKDRELPSAWSRFWSAVGRGLANFLERIFGGIRLPTTPANQPTPTAFSGISAFGWLLIAAGVLLVLGIIVYAVRGVRRSVVAEARARAEAAEEATLTTAQALERAQADVRAGDYRNGARHLYLSSLLWLEERGLLRYDRSRTNREYLQQVRGNPVHDDLVPVVETFERVWYGSRELDASDFDAYERQVAALRSHGEPPR